MSQANRALIAIVGRPNVGKSTLFNRLVGGRPALVHDTAGLTRDRRYGLCDLTEPPCELVDTGGLDPDAATEAIGAGIHSQARAALKEAKAIIFVIDARAGIMPVDRDLANEIRKLGKPVIVAANKIDHHKREGLLAEIYELGLEPVIATSGEHARGIDELLQAVEVHLPEVDANDMDDEDAEDENAPIRLALIGRPNVGKSSMMNTLLGQDRVLVHDAPGTTTDPVDAPFSFGGNDYTLIDTAGVRRKARSGEDIEKLSVALARNHIARADVVVHVIDSTQGATEQDARLSSLVRDGGTACVIALNKSDLLDREASKKAKQSIADQLHFLGHVPVVMTSALEAQGLKELMSKVAHVVKQSRRRITTAELNRFFEDVISHKPPPVYRGRQVRIQYVTQVAVAPPTFVMWTNRPKALSASYKRFVENKLREFYKFTGAPIRVYGRAKRKRDRKARP